MATLNRIYSPRYNQQGVVLVVSLVFLVALTGVAGALMQNSTTDMKMSGASQDKLIATQEAISAVDEIIEGQVTADSGDNNFAQPIVKYSEGGNEGINVIADVTNKDDINEANVDIANNPYGLEPDCPHSRSASSVQIFTCNVLRLRVNKSYGRKGNSDIDINTGIAQQLLK
ncbi:hypothetical protein HII17_05120 [Thalassotalea sp. M1531]|uniref:Type 4 fimbrial biogenesis protein PilX N-terminal domain-containing protein n=1 Tax=Thalassotalea algicola TaxID=2716224 RepID=A0A7Y0LAF4_9GAMM|nr:PilX N-terminal domain-containing pilus assembly protein [Thalassotalea algicola]NMP30939.1 hypothetical protein [Thalassotalea algicola]